MPKLVRPKCDSQADNFSLRGYRVLCFCPVCFRQILTVEGAALLKNAVQMRDVDFAEAFLAAHGCNLLVLVPRNIEVAQLLNNRVALAPICNRHSNLDASKIEHNIILASRFGKIIKGVESER